MSSFISAIESSFDWSKFRSRLPIARELPEYDLEAAIADYSKWQSVFHPHRPGLLFERYLDGIRFTKKYISESIEHHIQEIITEIMRTYSEYRNKYRIRYPLYLLLMTIIIAKNYGRNDAEGIAAFYNERYLEFFLMFPDVPAFITPISASTIRTAMQLITPKEAEKFFEEHFTKVKILIEDQIKYDEVLFSDRKDDIVDTIAFDGQEMKETYRKGDSNRRHKGGIVTQLFNSTQRTPLACAISEAKNHERRDVLSLIGKVDIVGQVVMCDKLNSSSDVSDAATAAGAYYLLPLGNNCGNKALNAHLKEVFTREHKHSIRYSETQMDKKARQLAENRCLDYLEKKANHGRREFLDIEILPANPYLDLNVKNPHKGVNVLIKKSKTDLTIRNNQKIDETKTEVYCVSSLPFDENYTIRQVRACFQDYWQIEENHSVLDDECIFNQDNLQACNANTINNTAILNKMCMPILSYIRQQLSIKAGRYKPLSYNAVMRYIQEMDLFVFMRYFCDYWFDKVDD